jgi:hypothetical protein
MSKSDLNDALLHLGYPPAIVADDIPAELCGRLGRNRTRLFLRQCGYLTSLNPLAKDGLYRVRGRRCAVYVREDLTGNAAIRAAEERFRNA